MLMTTELEALARDIRKDVVRMHRRGSNVASALSAVDILAVLYFDVMRIPSPDDPRRDRFILSKGHGASALYATLARRGFADPKLLETYLRDDSPLTGHSSKGLVPGIEVSTGSLGHGLAIGAGMALAARLDRREHRVFVLMGDGEIQEGSVWEAANLAARLRLDRLTAIVDVNRLQGYGRVDDIMPVASFADKWRAFGWAVQEADGHSPGDLSRRLRGVPFEPGKPSLLLAHTTKGKGVAEMEDCLGWHYFNVPDEKLDRFLEELDGPP
jgi:transketolase